MCPWILLYGLFVGSSTNVWGSSCCKEDLGQCEVIVRTEKYGSNFSITIKSKSHLARNTRSKAVLLRGRECCTTSTRGAMLSAANHPATQWDLQPSGDTVPRASGEWQNPKVPISQYHLVTSGWEDCVLLPQDEELIDREHSESLNVSGCTSFSDGDVCRSTPCCSVGIPGLAPGAVWSRGTLLTSCRCSSAISCRAWVALCCCLQSWGWDLPVWCLGFAFGGRQGSPNTPCQVCLPSFILRLLGIATPMVPCPVPWRTMWAGTWARCQAGSWHCSHQSFQTESGRAD